MMHPDQQQSLDKLRELVGAALVEAHIRKTHLDFYGTLVNNAMELASAIRSLEFAAHIQRMMLPYAPEGAPPPFGVEMTELLENIQELRALISEQLDELAQCPDPGTTIS